MIRILFLILISTIHAIGQRDFAVTLKGDTIKGKLKMSSIDRLDWLQITSDGKKTTYSALQIRIFQKEGTSFESVKHDGFRFLKVIKSGYLSLYAFNSSGQNTWDGRYLAKKDGTGIEIPNLLFKKSLSNYLGDCDDIKQRIDKGELGKKDIERIVEGYNVCLQTKTDAIVKPKEAVILENEKTTALKIFSEKVEAENFLTKKDVLDLLKDIQTKVSKSEAIPNYLTEGLKSYLADTPSLQKEVEDLVTLLKK